ncbi:MAG: N-acetylmuramoyl-L-alanine amidase [Leptospiraceae bacterium]|nr:N-acetylmuramoyl-L-alanine amidase [Leptospiraceae bacterium]
MQIPFENNQNYISFESLKKRFPELNLSIDYSTLKGKIQGRKKREILFRIGSFFYVYSKSLEKISRPFLHKKGKLLLPPDVVEVIFMYLTEKEVSYSFRENFIDLQISDPEKISSEKISLKNLIIDPGHGGKDPGSSDSSGVQEKDITLKTAKDLKTYLNKKYPNLNIVLTRSTDIFLELEERSEIANQVFRKKGESIYISLHCNSSLSTEPNGFEIYFLSQTPTTENARELAILENKLLSGKYSKDVMKIRASLLSSVVQRRSKKLAGFVEKGLEKQLSPKILNRGVKKADFSVLRGSLMPAILVEMGYLSNSKESKLIQKEKFRIRLLKGIAGGLHDYANAKD